MWTGRGAVAMKWLVTVALDSGGAATVEVFATNKADAEYRAAVKAEALYGKVVRVIACRKTR